MTRLRVLSLYEGLFSGGARVLHTNVVTGLHVDGSHDHAVLSLASQARREGALQPMTDDPRYRWLREAGIEVSDLGREASAVAPDPDSFTTAELDVAAAAVARADIILTLKEQPLGLLLALDARGLLPDVPIAACLHRSDPTHSGAALRWLAELAASGRLTSTISCADSTSDAYARFTPPSVERLVIPNGIDLARYRPKANERMPLRTRLGIAANAPVVLFAARFDAMKDPGLFLRAVTAHASTDARAHYLMCGAGMADDNAALTAAIAEAGAPVERIHRLGIRDDMPRVYRAADIVALTSAFGEASPLCLIEGAASGATPVTTAVGDSAQMVSGFGLVTPHDADAIAAAWAKVISRRPDYRAAALAARPRLGAERMLDEYRGAIDGLRERAEAAA
ncbi:Putative glycosyltransferase EpsF [Microbacterium oleivorans]|uniref:Glycosyltransferase n=1 Tax=Microbacterium oleivorans TaxID=273677 RepID=A0A031FK42_9MICO|nr:glycosyltransferase [Microbacterium oleivorans]AZS43244.1 Putative glycosyltransferase EpsF [Microbacterium oleivorans]EZP25199.1 Glycosyltransferase [Microbacterium oleivorans]